MSPFKRNAVYYLNPRWQGYPNLYLSTGTTNKARAKAMERTLISLRAAGRRDLIGLLAEKRITLQELHEAYESRGDELEQLTARAQSPRLGDLVAEWGQWLESPAGISPRTKRRYTARTVERYAVSWEGFFAVLGPGKDSRLSDLTKGFVLDYRRLRTRATGGRRRKESKDKPLSGATLNRDFAALGAFLRWVRDVKGLAVERPPIPREKETRGKERWLSAGELAAFETHCAPEWWPFFATLFYTGMRIGEARGLQGGDVQLSARRIAIHEGSRRVKSASAVRDLPIPRPLEEALAAHLVRVAPGPNDLVFQSIESGDTGYRHLRLVWDRTCEAAAIADATPHDARHTFAVHAAQAGVPIVRLQKLLGHATAAMTLRYMQHCPEAYLQEDGAAIAEHMSGRTDRELAARHEAARQGLKRA